MRLIDVDKEKRKAERDITMDFNVEELLLLKKALFTRRGENHGAINFFQSKGAREAVVILKGEMGANNVLMHRIEAAMNGDPDPTDNC